jgi:thiosulfate/3-mercaptopyruvate sulfurtransferase
LTTPAELAAALDAGIPPTVLDVRWRLGLGADRAAYEAGHLPGAVFIDLDRDLAAPPGPGRHPLPAPAAFEAAMRAAGVTADRPVVAYDAADATSAARAWWLLGWFGHPAPRVLDGGLAAWVAAGLPLTREASRPAPGDFTAVPGGRRALDAAGAARLAGEGGVLLDARAPERYRGETEPIDPVAGHIPGAVSAPAAGNLGGDGRLLPAAALRARFEALGVSDGGRVGAYCGSGVVAAEVVLALEVAGFEAELYAGSWSEWITDPERPVATG